METDQLSQVSGYLILDGGNRTLSQNIGNCNLKSKTRICLSIGSVLRYLILALRAMLSALCPHHFAFRNPK